MQPCHISLGCQAISQACFCDGGGFVVHILLLGSLSQFWASQQVATAASGTAKMMPGLDVSALRGLFRHVPLKRLLGCIELLA